MITHGCSTWFLDTIISTCSYCKVYLDIQKIKGHFILSIPTNIAVLSNTFCMQSQLFEDDNVYPIFKNTTQLSRIVCFV